MGDRGGRNGSEIAPRRNDGHGGRISEGAGRANAGPASGSGELRAAGQVQPGRDRRGGGVARACAAPDRDLRGPAGERWRPGALVSRSTSAAGPQAKPKMPAVGHLDVTNGLVPGRRQNGSGHTALLKYPTGKQHRPFRCGGAACAPNAERPCPADIGRYPP